MTRRFRPSQANYWGNCAAFMRFTENLPPQPDTDPAREGTCAAWVAERMINGEPVQVGDAHENGWIVDDQMIDHISEYVDLIRSFGGVVEAEKFVTASTNPLIEGTLDASVANVTNGTLRIIDLKYGRRIIEPTSKQLVCYGWGEYLKHIGNTIHTIELGIYQPRAFHRAGIFRTRMISVEQLHTEFKQLWQLAVESEKPDSLATPGTHCRDCDAASSCEALAHSTYNLVDTVTSRDHRDMTPLELSRELDFIDEAEKIIKARFEAVKAEAIARGKTENIPHWKFEPTTGNRAFTEKNGVTLHALTGVNPWKSAIVTPAELERRGADKELVKTITHRATTGMKLVRMDSDELAKLFTTKPEK
jgi:hypothetical protein